MCDLKFSSLKMVQYFKWRLLSYLLPYNFKIRSSNIACVVSYTWWGGGGGCEGVLVYEYMCGRVLGNL